MRRLAGVLLLAVSAFGQAKQLVSNAELDLINRILAHNVAKLSLARAIGNARSHIGQLP